MTSVVMLAGYNRTRDIREYAKIVASSYGEKFIETGYKPLRTFEVMREGIAVQKPLIQFTLEQLLLVDEIDEIVIVGHRDLLEQRLGKFVEGFDKVCTFIDQKKQLSGELVERFHVEQKRVRAGSIAANIVLGYGATKACDVRGHVLFVGADSPFTSRKFIEYFLRIGRGLENEYSIIVPAVLVSGDADTFGRLPLKLVNDSGFKNSEKQDTFGRQGFRASSLVYANPHGFDTSTINSAYGLRKGLSPSIQLKLFRITRRLGYPNIYTKYFIKKNLSISEVERITSLFLGGKLKVVPVRDVESSYDYDGTEHELRQLGDMLKSQRE